MNPHPSYLRVFRTFVRNSLVRDMMFPANFIIETISSIAWVMMNLGLYLLIFHYTPYIGSNDDLGAAWDKYQFFVFLATSMLVNNLVQMFFMPNAEEFSELIRTGNLDFALLEADRHAVSDLAAEGRLVVAGESGAGARAAWATRCRGSTGSRRRSRRCCSIRSTSCSAR